VEAVKNPFGNELRIRFEWQDVTDSGNESWPFETNAKLKQELRESFKGPRIYRFIFPGGAGYTPHAYVGETENFCIRYRHYRRKSDKAPTSSSNRLDAFKNAWKRLQRYSGVRVSAAVKNARVDNRLVKLQFLQLAEFATLQAKFDQNSISDTFVRRALENLAIIQTEAEGFRTMNRGRNVDPGRKWWLEKCAERDRALLKRI
jgi:hypothetical protein